MEDAHSSFHEDVLALEIDTSLENQLQSTFDRIRNDGDESKKIMLDCDVSVSTVQKVKLRLSRTST